MENVQLALVCRTFKHISYDILHRLNEYIAVETAIDQYGGKMRRFGTRCIWEPFMKYTSNGGGRILSPHIMPAGETSLRGQIAQRGHFVPILIPAIDRGLPGPPAKRYLLPVEAWSSIVQAVYLYVRTNSILQRQVLISLEIDSRLTLAASRHHFGRLRESLVAEFLPWLGRHCRFDDHCDCCTEKVKLEPFTEDEEIEMNDMCYMSAKLEEAKGDYLEDLKDRADAALQDDDFLLAEKDYEEVVARSNDILGVEPHIFNKDVNGAFGPTAFDIQDLAANAFGCLSLLKSNASTAAITDMTRRRNQAIERGAMALRLY